ncbi:MAG: glutamine amidotransferase-related protein [Nitrososphaeria archaeon]
MILVLDICSDRLSRLEFVRPIEQILNRLHAPFKTRHYSSVTRDDLEGSEKVIICGAALRDLVFLNQLESFGWLKDTGMPVLGIGMGIYAVVKALGGDLVGKKMIGQFRVNVVEANKLCRKDEFYAYFLNLKAAKSSEDFRVLARAESVNCLTKHHSREVYCCLFHPEVLNPEIVANFCENI